MKIKLKILLFFMLGHINLNAQYFDLSQNIYNPTLYSSAFAGADRNSSLFTGFSKQWTGISGSPQNVFMSYGMPILKNNGIAAHIFNNVHGNFNDLQIDIQSSYKVKISASTNLFFGIETKFYHSYFNFSNVKSQLNDPIFQNMNSLKYNSFDFGAGLAFVSPKIVFSLSSNSLLGTEFKNNQNPALNERYTNVWTSMSYNQKVNQNINSQLSVILYKEFYENSAMNYKISVVSKFKDRAHIILSYRNQQFFGIGAGGALSDNLVLSYFFESSFGAISGISSGTHQINIGFLINRHADFSKNDIFPYKKTDIIADENRREIHELKNDLESLKNHFNKTITYQDNRLKTVENAGTIDSKVNKSKKIVWKDTIVNENIKFAINTDLLYSSSSSEIDKLLFLMFENPSAVIQIQANTYNLGSPIYLKQLSERRAIAIKKVMTDKGINEKRIIIEAGNSGNKEFVKIIISE